MEFPTLKTGRLILRQARAADLSRLVDYANSYEVASMLSGMAHPFTQEDGNSFIHRGNTNDPEKVVLWVIDDGSGLIGSTWMKLDGETGWVGFWIGKPHWGKGHMSEALQAALSYAFDERGISRFSAGVFHDNPASFRVLEKLGFSQTGENLIPSKGRGGTMVPHILMELPKAAFLCSTSQAKEIA
ncbi:ribosomal-protein-S5-alanine N-acetyltransferase [Pseudovibrio axinellae]|uniref:Ribosomal-protein-S5-alanine N-acetyltransferase n=1 Tax=Pseudovibrio axinellae TaxID=989403 RepID=A0A165YY27_9HYPH|nr:GNAT family protein [Pseudovibrio axinellae]KZL19337.1 ribosomal-protein-S5-alanine N-acetyltransferase [Pseudovibrio axinellae]SEQ40783.1 ribosomal-protein-alanine N-acetyltransferase [Pseudovibrio axinellae]